MTSIYLILSVVLLLAAGFAAQAAIIRSRRKKWMRMRFSDKDRQAIERDFAVFSRIPSTLRDELEGLMHVFIYEKSFEACGGMESVTKHMQHVIAAQACLLLVNRQHDFYRKLRSVLLYPSAYKARNEHGQQHVRLGESWGSGSVVLAWESVVAGGKNQQDGSHVTLHEFAHQLDQADGAADGVPELAGAGSYRQWSRVFGHAFERFQKKLDQGRRTVIDPYGATNPAEFFAVATETFYEKPKQLSEHYPEVYQELREYYRVDPLKWG
ncbi:MAG: zinc-dependent peptidase [Akkermansiaceae bacterium]|nr:zinc-dependent peptidase [Akkermansiaceae bacterium]